MIYDIKYAVRCLIYIKIFSSLSAIFLPPSKVDTLYDLLWFVAVNDFMLKFLAVILKIGLIFTPGQIVPYQKRVSKLVFLERFL